MSRHQYRNTVNNSQDKMSLPEPSSMTTVDPVKCNKAEAQDKDFEIGFMNVMKDIEKAMNNSINKINENTDSGMKSRIQFKI